MTTIAQTECCAMLGIDPKTLRNWMRHTNMLFTAHPIDARLKCLTMQQVQQLATLHSRPLSLPVSLPAVLPEDTPETTSTPASQNSQAQPLQAATPFPASLSEEGDLIKQVASLETKVSTMQEQLAQLALAVLSERSLRYEQRLMALETHVQQAIGPCPPAPPALQETDVAQTPGACSRSERRLLPVELHARSRITPLVEYGAQGHYVVVCPQEGVLPFPPDSPEWFDWLASLTSFRFVGPPGRFTAYRDSEHGQRTRSWTAHRCIHGRHYHHYLGVTDRLTLTRLEQMAAKLHAHFTTL